MKEPKKRVTIYDIAKKLNVSSTTVSRALSDHHSIGKKTKKAVREMAREMNYQPNTIASSLRKNKTNTIGVLIPRINRPFISSFISGIEEVANKAGYNVLISQSHDSYEREVANASSFVSSRVDGIIASLAMETTDYSHFAQFDSYHIPLVLADRVCEDLVVDKVVIDNFSAAFNATEHLIESGYRRIAHFAGSSTRNVYKERIEGYIAALKKHGLPVDDNLIINGFLSREEGEEAAKKLLSLDVRPDAIFSANDTAAVSAMIYVQNQGLRIPEDLAFVGFNDDPIATIVQPPLTSVSHPALEIGKYAAERILKRIENPKLGPAEDIVLKTSLKVRQSSQPVHSVAD